MAEHDRPPLAIGQGPDGRQQVLVEPGRRVGDPDAEAAGPAQKLTDLAGLYRRSPLLAGCLAIFVLSLAGIPPLAGFFGKFAVFAAVLRLGGLGGPVGWLAIAAIALSAVGLYYYLLILKQALVAPPAGDAPAVKLPVPAALALLTAAALLVVLGVLPSLILGIF